MATYSLSQPLTSVRGGIPEPGVVRSRGKGLVSSSSHPSWAAVASAPNRRDEAARLCSQASRRTKLVSQFWSVDSRHVLMMMNKCPSSAAFFRPGSHLVVVRTRTHNSIKCSELMGFALLQKPWQRRVVCNTLLDCNLLPDS